MELTARLFFFSKSADRYPGKGTNEYAPSGMDLHELASVRDWRKMLSNFYDAPISMEEGAFLSVECYYQAMKFFPHSFYKSFLLSSEDPWAHDSASAKLVGGASGYKLGRAPIQANPAFWPKKDEYMKKALLAKFKQHADLRKVLLATKDVELWHGTRGQNERQFLLEEVRHELSQ